MGQGKTARAVTIDSYMQPELTIPELELMSELNAEDVEETEQE